MVDFSKYRPGYVVAVHCCDECARKAGVVPKLPADSGVASRLCDVCGHHAIGSLMDCEIGDWLRLHPLQPNARNQPPLDAIYAEADRLGCRLPSGDSPEGYGITLSLKNLRTEG